MFKSILVPIDLADTDLAKPAIATAATLSQTWNGAVRLLNVMPMTPVMLAEYVPADFDTQQRETSEEALAIVARESGIEASRISYVVRQGGIYHEILEEAAAIKADLIVMTSHRPAMRTYFLGSNAGHVVRYAKCSVLVVRHWPCATKSRNNPMRVQAKVRCTSSSLTFLHRYPLGLKTLLATEIAGEEVVARSGVTKSRSRSAMRFGTCWWCSSRPFSTASPSARSSNSSPSRCW